MFIVYLTITIPILVQCILTSIELTYYTFPLAQKNCKLILKQIKQFV